VTQSPPVGMPQITPYLLYEDVDAAVDWLVDTFGFTEHVRMNGPDGKALHAEIHLGAGVVMLGNPGGDYRSPRHLGGATQLVYVYVDNVDEHYERAMAKGAHILRDLADQFYGDRTYGVEDPEGHQWSFGQHVRDVDAQDMHP